MSDMIIGRGTPFTEAQQKVMAAIADAAIPQDETLDLPSAADPIILSKIIELAEPFETRVKSGVGLLVSEVDVLSIAPNELFNLLQDDARFRSFLRVLTIVFMQAYYQDPRVLAALGFAPRAPFPQGHELEQGDWSLLEPVKRRAAFYRTI